MFNKIINFVITLSGIAQIIQTTKTHSSNSIIYLYITNLKKLKSSQSMTKKMYSKAQIQKCNKYQTTVI